MEKSIVEHFPSRTRFVLSRERDEAEPAWPPRGAIPRDTHVHHRAARCFEKLTQHSLGDRIRQARYEELASVVDRHVVAACLGGCLLQDGGVDPLEAPHDIVFEKPVKRYGARFRGPPPPDPMRAWA